MSFYGKRSRHDVSLKARLARREKEFKQHKIPCLYQPNLNSPSQQWQVFYRQDDAFKFAKANSKELRVFSFESESFAVGQGKRMYVAAAYEHFWHYYKQLQARQRHHYEIIPEDTPCHLYFDLEYSKEYNPDLNGDQMVNILIKYVCAQFKEIFEEMCDQCNVLQLDATTKKKFSRHLIFKLPHSVFQNNIHAGNFVHHILYQIWCTVYRIHSNPSKKLERESTAKESSIQSQQTAQSVAIESSIQTQQTTQSVAIESSIQTQQTTQSVAIESSIQTQQTAQSVAIESSIQTQQTAQLVAMESSIQTQQTAQSVAIESSIQTQQTAQSVAIESSIQTQQTAQSVASETILDQPQSLGATFFRDSSLAVCDLQSLLVKDKHKEDTFFCDTGVYTRNRNFRLYLSSKLGKDNPLVLAESNTYQPQLQGRKNMGRDEQIFLDSLISNVRCCDSLKVLTFYTECGQKPRTRTRGFGQEATLAETAEMLAGYSGSPYPEIDDFISTVISKGTVRGVIRRWTYFPNGELLVFDILYNRWCANIGRPHRSNNIRLVADLKRGVYYQKCHDPDCAGFKSPEEALPRQVLPSTFFAEQTDTEEEDVPDGDLLQAVGQIESELEPSDAELLQFVHQVESSTH